MSFDVKSEILATIGKTNDDNMKAVLLLLLGVFEDIGAKLDAVIRNETGLRALVLNGHADVHHDHHEWLSKRIDQDAHVAELVTWVERRKATEERRADRGAAAAWSILEKIIAAAVLGTCGFLLGKFVI